jgi:phasin family protein
MDKTPMPFMDISKLMEQFKIPGVDLGAVVEARRKDIEALTQANQQAYQGMQALAQRQAEILKETMSEWQTSMQGMMGKNPGDIVAKQVALATEAFEKALANMRELSEIASRSQIQALETVNKRFQENLQELRKLMQPK